MRIESPLDGLVAHEIFHVITRHHPELRDRLYAVIGFEPCRGLKLPESLEARKLTNPDAPLHQHSIGVEVGGEPARVVPVLVAAREFDHESDADLLDYARLDFLLVEEKGGRWVAVEDGDGEPVAVSPMRMKNFAEQIGKNTGYIIHPEEILAENFRHLVLGTERLPDPQIPEKMRGGVRRRRRVTAVRLRGAFFAFAAWPDRANFSLSSRGCPTPQDPLLTRETLLLRLRDCGDDESWAGVCRNLHAALLRLLQKTLDPQRGYRGHHPAGDGVGLERDGRVRLRSGQREIQGVALHHPAQRHLQPLPQGVALGRRPPRTLRCW